MRCGELAMVVHMALRIVDERNKSFQYDKPDEPLCITHLEDGAWQIPGSEGGSRPRPCENVREPRKRRTGFSIAVL